MDLRVFVLICLAAASRHQPSSVLEVEAHDPQNESYDETDFQRLRNAVNSGDSDRMSYIADAKMWPSFVKAHPEEGWRLFKKLAKDEHVDVKLGAALSPAWPVLLEAHHAEAWQLLEKLAKDENWKVRAGAVKSPAWAMRLETHNAELFQKLAKDENVNVTQQAAYSPAWPMLLETHNAAAWQLFQKLATGEDSGVRLGAAYSPAWPMLLATHNAAAWRLFEKLAQDEDVDVRRLACYSPAWPDLIKSNLSQSWQLFAELMSDQELRDPFSLEALVDLPSWKAFGKVPPTAVTERDSQELQDIARSLQKVADTGLSHEVQGLPLFDGFSTQLPRSTNETWLGEMVKLQLFAGNAALGASLAENVYSV